MDFDRRVCAPINDAAINLFFNRCAVPVLPDQQLFRRLTVGRSGSWHRAQIRSTRRDEIIALNNVRLDRFDPEQMREFLSASRERPAHLVLRGAGNVRLREVTMYPEEMQAPSVDRAFLLRPGIV